MIKWMEHFRCCREKKKIEAIWITRVGIHAQRSSPIKHTNLEFWIEVSFVQCVCAHMLSMCELEKWTSISVLKNNQYHS